MVDTDVTANGNCFQCLTTPLAKLTDYVHSGMNTESRWKPGALLLTFIGHL